MRALCVLLRSLGLYRRGATAIEYALIAALVALTAATVGNELAGFMHNVGASLAGVPRVEVYPP